MALSFGYNFIASVDRYMLAGKISDGDFAVYTQGFRISAIISMVVSSFNFAFGPFLLSILGQPQAPGIISRFHTYYLMVMCFVSLCFMALAKIIIHILAGYDYIGGQKFMLLFVTGYIFYGMYSFAQAGIIHSRKSYLSLYTLSAGFAVVFLVDFLSVKTYMGYGTAIGFMLANITMVMLAAFFSAKYIPVRYNIFKDAILLLLVFGGGLLLSLFNLSPNIYIDGGVKLGAVIFLSGAFIFTLLSGTDKLIIKNFLAGKKIPSV
jgi:O-antigen/teichoic acid export membrane protein